MHQSQHAGLDNKEPNEAVTHYQQQPLNGTHQPPKPTCPVEKDVRYGRFPEEGQNPLDAANAVREQLKEDFPPVHNFASYLTAMSSTPELEQLMNENAFKNMGEIRAYPGLAKMEQLCIAMMANLYHGPGPHLARDLDQVGEQPKFYGSCTVGSSEAIMLAGLAMKRRWQELRRSQHLDASKPNILVGHNAHTAQRKFANYFEVEERLLNVSESNHYSLDPGTILDNVDENTIGVFVVLGNNYTGHFDDVAAIAAVLDEYQTKTGHDIPIHVDGAVGGFVAPFVYDCDETLKWDFAIPRVQSINASGHKNSFTPPGTAWIIWKSREWYPESLIHHITYLIAPFETPTLNLSRPSAPLITEYFNFKHLGFAGFRRFNSELLARGRRLSNRIESLPWFVCVSDIHRRKGHHMADDPDRLWSDETSDDPAHYNYGVPVVAFKLRKTIEQQHACLKLEDISKHMLEQNLLVPCYQLPTKECGKAMRIVIREEMTSELIGRIVLELSKAAEKLTAGSALQNGHKTDTKLE